MKTKKIVYFSFMILFAVMPSSSVFAACPDPTDPVCPEYGDPNAPCPNVFNKSCPNYDPNGGGGTSDLGDAPSVDPSNPLFDENNRIYNERGAEVLKEKADEKNPDLPFADYSSVDDEMCLTDAQCNSNNLITAFDGWQDDYLGYERSSLVFDPKGKDAERAYPGLASNDDLNKKDSKMKDRSLGALDLGVTDEVSKSTMTPYQPIGSLYNSSASSEYEVGQYTDRHKTIWGTANLTLSQLDKTVAASTAVTEQQLAAKASNDLLKQVSQTSARMADPELDTLYRDNHEKIEACMAAKGEISGGKVKTKGFSNIRFECAESCGTTPKEVDVDGKKVAGGLYGYCVCCAETSGTVNKTTMEDSIQFKTEQWSLVDRIFFGNDISESGVASDRRKYVILTSTVFKNMYGDKVMEAKDGKISIKYRLPKFTPSQKINILRNGPGGTGDEGSPFCIKEANEGDQTCVGTGQRMKYGICPAILSLLRKYPGDSDASKSEENKELWAEASLGYILTPDILNAFLGAEGIIDENKKSDWKPSGRTARLLESFCDASAVAAFKKFHYQMQAIAADHLMQNQVASAKERADFQDLTNRVSYRLALAEEEADADYRAKALVAGLESESDAYRLSTNAASVGAAQAAQRASQSLSGTSGFGANGAQLGK